jgi:Fe-S-cluster containining protein
MENINGNIPSDPGKSIDKNHNLSTDNSKGKMDTFRLNREIAYKGHIGRLREEFCLNFIQKKHEFFKDLSVKQNEITSSKDEKITCGKGCCRCCQLFVGASIQDGEGIVYYLYQNEEKLDRFLQNYSIWREKVRESGDLFRNQPLNNSQKTDNRYQNKNIGDLAEYAKLGIPCPFLNDGACYIYEVRPFVCGGLIVTTPAEWCNPLHPEHDKKKTYKISNAALEDRTFYGEKLEKPVWAFMPIMVHNILAYGLEGLPNKNKMQNLINNYLSDPEVQFIIRKYVNSAKGKF